MKKTVVLTILDGLGCRNETKGNAFAMADTKVLDSLFQAYPNAQLQAAGLAVGLPAEQMGNSEVGHMNIGAGRMVEQPLLLINRAIDDESFYANEKLLAAITHAKKNQAKLHIMGLLSDGGVHSHLKHILALLDLCARQNFCNVYLHIITDGRDTLPKASLTYVKELDDYMQKLQIGKVASIMGRYYAMDRDQRWERTKSAYDILVGNKAALNKDVYQVIEASYQNDITDEFIVPQLLNQEGIISDNDAILFANFRTERATQLLMALTNDEFNAFSVKKLTNIKLVGLMPCDEKVKGVSAFQLEKLTNTLGEYLSSLNYQQLRIAETEKYAHVTYFFDGGKNLSLPGCEKKLISSPTVATYDLQPEMSAWEVRDEVVASLQSGQYDIIILNFANPDMVGHTGNLSAAVTALEAIDQCINTIYQVCQENEQLLILTADHGNVEEMLDNNNNILTAHTSNPVPFIVCDKRYQVKNGKLADIAPTLLAILELDQPPEMTGDVLITKND